jgi:integration host factor subunit beta
MTKSDLIRIVARAHSLSQGHAKAMVDQVFACIEEALRTGERVEVRALGSFEVRHYGTFAGRNPRTGAVVTVKPKRLPFFRTNRKLRQLLNPQVTRTQELPAIPEDGQGAEGQAGLRTA